MTFCMKTSTFYKHRYITIYSYTIKSSPLTPIHTYTELSKHHYYHHSVQQKFLVASQVNEWYTYARKYSIFNDPTSKMGNS